MAHFFPKTLNFVSFFLLLHHTPFSNLALNRMPLVWKSSPDVAPMNKHDKSRYSLSPRFDKLESLLSFYRLYFTIIWERERELVMRECLAPLHTVALTHAWFSSHPHMWWNLNLQKLSKCFYACIFRTL